MAQSIDYKILPLTYLEFLAEYNGFIESNGLNSKEEYKKYLQQNSHQHHYNAGTLETWYAKEIIV